MIGVSDNTATDVILRMAGGPVEVTRRLRQLGIEDVDVDRTQARTFADLVGIPDTVPESELYRYSFFRKRDALPQEVRQEARLRYADDPRDTATPEAMARLLVEAWRDRALSCSRSWPGAGRDPAVSRDWSRATRRWPTRREPWPAR
jgi:beta-lactamase class A